MTREQEDQVILSILRELDDFLTQMNLKAHLVTSNPKRTEKLNKILDKEVK
jgi:hypothetical protein